jgi:DNA-3-methyladenine glycosylase
VRVLPAAFYLRDAVAVARDLLGKLLVREPPDGAPGARGDGGRLIGRIVETEAYRQDDPASHSFRGPTPRNRAMFSRGGTAYVYFIYGRQECLNVVTGPEGDGSAVLIRALEPLEGLPAMWSRRFPGRPFDPGKIALLCSGPARLARALRITVERHNGRSLQSGELTLQEDEPAAAFEIELSPRVGIRQARDRLWRFTVRGSPFLSKP